MFNNHVHHTMPTHLSGNSDPSCLRFSRLCRLAQLHEALDKSVSIESNYLEMLKHPEHGTKFNFASTSKNQNQNLTFIISTACSLPLALARTLSIWSSTVISSTTNSRSGPIIDLAGSMKHLNSYCCFYSIQICIQFHIIF